MVMRVRPDRLVARPSRPPRRARRKRRRPRRRSLGFCTDSRDAAPCVAPSAKYQFSAGAPRAFAGAPVAAFRPQVIVRSRPPPGRHEPLENSDRRRITFAGSRPQRDHVVLDRALSSIPELDRPESRVRFEDAAPRLEEQLVAPSRGSCANPRGCGASSSSRVAWPSASDRQPAIDPGRVVVAQPHSVPSFVQAVASPSRAPGWRRRRGRGIADCPGLRAVTEGGVEHAPLPCCPSGERRSVPLRWGIRAAVGRAVVGVPVEVIGRAGRARVNESIEVALGPRKS